MIGAFVLFGLPDSSVFAAVFAYRAIAFWLPIPPGIVAFFQLRRNGSAVGWGRNRDQARRHTGADRHFIK